MTAEIALGLVVMAWMALAGGSVIGLARRAKRRHSRSLSRIEKP